MEMIHSLLMTIGLLAIGAAIAFISLVLWMWWLSR
jgi:hypothetical protein